MQTKIYRTTSALRSVVLSERKKSFAHVHVILVAMCTLLLCFHSQGLVAQSWTQKGTDIDGVPGEQAGMSVSMSSDGNTIAIGNNDDDISGNAVRSSVKVRRWDGTSWVQRGSTLYAAQGGDNFGVSVSLSADGDVLAIGAPNNYSTFGDNSNAGTAYVYTWNGSDWQLRGNVFHANAAQENFGSAVSLTDDGNILAVGAPGTNAGGSFLGTVRVFQWSGTAWTQLGGDLVGAVNSEQLGNSVSIKSPSGNIILAAGASQYSTSTGRVKVYRYSAGTWSSPDLLNGDAVGDIFGNSVSLSSMGTRLVVGAPTDLLNGTSYVGYVRAFDYASGTWSAVGATISSAFEADEFGKQVSLSGDGTTVIIGAQTNQTGSENGRAEVYSFTAGSWQKVGANLVGEAANDRFGIGVAINNNGSRIAIGAQSNTGGGIDAGQVRVYSLACAPPAGPTGTATQTFCAGSTVAQLTATGTAIQWYAAATGGTALATTTTLTNNTTYYASQTVSECESTSRFAVSVTINTTATPTGSATQTFCNAATVANLTVTGTDIKWYDAATGGNVLNSTAALATNTKYYASQTLNTCESLTRLEVTVTVNAPAAPTGTAQQSFCNGGTIADLAATGTGIKWYDAATGGNVLTTTTALANATSYYASQTVNGCESTSRLQVTVTIAIPPAPTGAQTQSFCNVGTIASLVATPQSGNTIKWYAAASGGTSLASTTPLVDGTTYHAAQALGTCESTSRLAVTVTLLPLPTQPAVSVTQPTCTVATGTITVTTQQSGETYSFNNGTDYQAANTKAGVAAGSYQIIIKGTNGCASTASAAVVNAQPATPATPVVSVTQPTCATATGTVTVTKQNTGETYSFNNGTDFQTDNSKAGLAAGTYQVIIKSANGCSSVAASATVNAPPAVSAAPTGNAAQGFCVSGTVAQLTATGTAIKWYAAATGGTALAGSTALVNDVTYFASQTVTCESTSRLAVKVTVTNPAAPTGEANQVFCKASGTVADLSATAPEAISWYAAATGGTPLASTVALSEGTTYYGGYTQNGCVSPRMAVTIEFVKNWKYVSAGMLHVLAIRDNGTLWGWGTNSSGEVNNGSSGGIITRPIQIGTDQWKQVAAGYKFSVGLKADGTLWTWGFNDQGQLGRGANPSGSMGQVGAAKWKSISATYNHVLALREDGTLWAWGGNFWGQLSTLSGISFGDEKVFKNEPVQLGTANNWVFIATGWGTSAAIKQDGTLWNWGSNEFGQLGNGSKTPETEGVPEMKQVGTDKWKFVAMGVNASIGIKENNTLWTTGLNSQGQLGNGTKTQSLSYVQIGGSSTWTSAIMMGFNGAALKADGTLWTWGSNDYGQLGIGTAGASTTAPGQVGSSDKWESVSGFSFHSVGSATFFVGIQKGGSLWSWGSSSTGTLGTGAGSSFEPARLGANTSTVPKPTLTLSALTPPLLTASAGSEHLWYKNGSIIAGASGNTYSPPASAPEGNYTVAIVDLKGCSSVPSNEVVIYITGLEYADRATVQVYPNPAYESILVPGIEEQAKVTIFSLTGTEQQVNSEWVAGEKARRVYVGELTNGMYLLRVQQGNKTAAVKFFKQ